MKHIVWIAALLLFAPLGAFAQEHGHDEKEKAEEGEIRVYLADQNKKSVDLKGITATIIVEPVGGKKRVLRAKLVTPKGTKKQGLGHGGEVRKTGRYHVEFAVVKSHAHEEGHGHDAKTKDATPYFSAELHPLPAKFAAVVIFRIKGKTINAKGFEHPPAVPNNYAGAVGRIEEHLAAIQALIDSDGLEKVHAVAEKISYVCEKLPALAPHDDKAEVEKTCKAVIALFKEIDEVADAGKKRETIQVLSKYKMKVAQLKKHAEGEDHGDHDDGASKTTSSLHVTYFYLPG